MYNGYYGGSPMNRILSISKHLTQTDLALPTPQLTTLVKFSESTLPELADLRMKLRLLELEATTATRWHSATCMSFLFPLPSQVEIPLATVSVSGTLARLIIIQTSIHDLMQDLQREQAKKRLVVQQKVEGATAGAFLEDKIATR
ncbi:hypothetical protein D9756_010160 [Leucocoprinus leucothites]|uniref:Uncharacterized protein n=1 Tax=Leucocoprinus leucothites TaxID=201217 RepID=A0A8H5CVR1_9AGAR|nr:hypothetical protein D9756_010160 [Leucoagaricus leucothites]